MYVDVTDLVETGEMFEFSASRMERGNNAGPETWANAKEEAAARPILAADQLPVFRDYMREFGAWDDAEIDAWDSVDCNALMVQLVAGDVREMESLCPGDGPGGIDWQEAERLSQEGTISGRMEPGDDGRIWYYAGS